MTAMEIFAKIMSLVKSRDWLNDGSDAEWEELVVAMGPLSFSETSLLLNKLAEQREAMNLGQPNPIDSCIGYMLTEGLCEKFMAEVKKIEAEKGLSDDAHKDVARIVGEAHRVTLFALGEQQIGAHGDSGLTYHAAAIVYLALAEGCDLTDED